MAIEEITVEEAGEEMAWVSVHDNVIGGKLRELAKEIDCTQEEALGILVSLWLWSLNNADKEGRLISADKEDVLEAFSVKLVNKMASVGLVDCLIKTRWIDQPEPGVLVIHDWDQWQAQWYKAMERREKDNQRKKEGRKLSGQAQTDDDGQEEVPDAQPGAIEGDPPVAEPEKPKYAPAFEQFWTEYPRKADKGLAYKKYRARRKDGYSDEDLLIAARNYALQCKMKKTEKDFIKHPRTFLGDAMPFIEFIPKQREAANSAPVQNPEDNPFSEYDKE